jgi:hypothetical protein
MATAGTFGNYNYATTELATNSHKTSPNERAFIYVAMSGAVCGAIAGAMLAASSVLPAEIGGLFGTLIGSPLAVAGWSLFNSSSPNS